MFSLILAASLLASPTITTGDVVTMPIPHSGIPEDAFYFPFRVYDPALNLKFSVPALPAAGQVAIDSQHNLSVLSGGSLNQYDASFHWLREWKMTENGPAAFVIDDSARAYVLGGGGYLSVIGVDGQLDHMTRLPDFPYATAIDLAPDQCTLFYLDFRRHVRRFDVCRNTAVQDYASDIPGEYLRALSDGGIAVLHEQKINFYDATGRLTYTFASKRISDAFTFDSALGSIWLVSVFGALRVRLSDGAEIGSIVTASGRGTLAVAGELRPSSTNVVPVPRQRSVRR